MSWQWLLSLLLVVEAFLSVPSTPSSPTITSPTTVVQPTSTTTTAAVPDTVPTYQAPQGDDFWRRLANCEQPDGPNYFQFMGGTAEKVGWYPSASYAAQRDMAINWAAQVHPNEGTSAGWPHCWWVALRG